MKKIVVGISGGIDSAITAYKLKQEGYEVIGAHLQISDDIEPPKHKLEKISNSLNIPITIINGVEAFKYSVLKSFRDDHLAGRTPSPCATCNPNLKWKLLLDFADQQGIDFVASGHYIQKEQRGGYWYLKKGEDSLKDQSYYLWGLNQQQLARVTTPLGVYNKSEVKELANEIGLSFLSEQKESTGLCFASGLSYPDLLRKIIPETAKIHKGDLINKDGDKIGEHKGYIYYTIGQKKDLLFFDKKYQGNCVISILAKENILVVGKAEELWVKEFVIDSNYFINEKQVLNSDNLEVKVRGIGRNPKGYAKLIKLSKKEYKVVLENPAWAMAPGQPVVFYEDNYLLGGGYMQS